MRQQTIDLRRLGTSVYKTLEEVPSEKEEYMDNQPNFDYKDESYNYLINMKIERFLSPENKILKILRNKLHTLIISEVHDKVSPNFLSNFTKTLEIVVCINIYKEKTNTIRLKFFKKFILTFTEELGIVENHSFSSQKEHFFEIFLVNNKFLIIDSAIKILLVDYLNSKSATLLIKSRDRYFNIIYCLEEYVRNNNGQVNQRGYLFGITHDRSYYYFILDDDLLERNREENFNLVLKKINIENSESVKDFKVYLV
jgi:hypothetical protein